MRTILLTLCTLAAPAFAQPPRPAAQEGAPRAGAGAVSAQAAAWERFAPRDEEFSVELPGTPGVFHTSRVIRNTPPYDSDEMRVFGLYSGGVIYMIASYDRPRSSETLDSFANYIWDARGLAPVRDLTLGGSGGREYKVCLSDLKGAARVFRTKKHAYLLKAFSKAEGLEQAVERFLNSLVLEGKHSFGPGDAPARTAASPCPPPERGTSGPGIGTGVPKPERREGDGAAAGDGPFSPRDVTRRALIVYKPEPGFTEKARRNNRTGVVRLRGVLSSSGKMTNIQVVKELPDGLTDKAVEAARHILFFPAEKDGRQVSQYVVLEYNFNIY